ncbi:MAG: 6-bladed beta-propeller [Acidobacteria bacterium]|nr:6-bladed beta-propeller [Acidobacteriota bacterium]
MLPSESKWYTKFRGGPDKILVDRDGNVLVLASGVVLKLKGESGEVLGAAHGTDYIHDAATTADGGLLLVSEKGGDDELVRLDAKGKPVRRVHRFMSSILEKRLQVRVVRVASDGVGNVFAVYALGDASGEFWYDAEDLAVLRLTPEGKYINRFGSSGNGPGQYSTPNCIAVDNQSRVYICDSQNGVHLFAPDGRYLENIKTPFWVDGLALDGENNIYVVGSNKVAKIAARK